MNSPTTWAPKPRVGGQTQDATRDEDSGVVPLPVPVPVAVGDAHDPVDMDTHERKIVNEFCHYLEKSKQLFNGLR